MAEARKIHCKSCGWVCAEIIVGSKIRKNAVVLCQRCYDRMKVADDMAKMTTSSAPDFLKGIFGSQQ